MTFSSSTAHALAQAARAVYLDDPEDWAHANGYSEFRWYEAFDTQAMVIASDTVCVAAFRGTEPDDLGDWMTDFDVRQVPGPYGEVHSGFLAALAPVYEEMRYASMGRRQSVFITGHSLGAALATIFTAKIGFGQLYTFGSPRVGDRCFARTFNNNHESYRFVNNNDAVTRLPLGVRYAHVGELYHFTAGGQMLVNPSKWRVELDRVWGRFFGFVDGIRDHSMDEYVRLTMVG